MKKLKSLPRSKRYLLIAGLLLFAGLLAAAFLYDTKKSDVSDKAVIVCSDEVLKKAGTLLAPDKFAELEKVVGQVTESADFRRDPNCLYVVTTYYINISDSANARLHLTELEKVFAAESMNKLVYNETTLRLDQLQKTVTTLEDVTQKNRQQNVPSVEGPAGEE